MSESYKVSVRLLCIVCFFVVTDLLLQGLYRVLTGEYTWEFIQKVEVFDIGYVDFVDDERYVIPDVSYKDERIAFDEYGFRRGHNVPSKKDKNIVFLGDSVPFGYGADAEDTVPSLVSDLFEKDGRSVFVINAAVPSYSLNQAVYRYIYDIERKFPVSIIVLHVYDPAENFNRLQHDWDVNQNWYTTSGHKKIGSIKRYTDWRLQYSSIFYLFWRFSGLYFDPVKLKEKYDDHDLERYKDSIVQSLDSLVKHASDVDHIILMPITRPSGVMLKLTEYEKKPIVTLNDVFKTFASLNQNVHFLDTTSLFTPYPDTEIFADVCCHLTPKGLELQAHAIYEALLQY